MVESWEVLLTVHGRTTGGLYLLVKKHVTHIPFSLVWPSGSRDHAVLKKKYPWASLGYYASGPLLKQLHSAFTCQRTESTYLWIFRTAIVCNSSCEDGSGRLLDPVVMATKISLSAWQSRLGFTPVDWCVGPSTLQPTLFCFCAFRAAGHKGR